MEFTIINPVESYRARVEQTEREYLNHTLFQEEIKNNPDVTGDEEKAALGDSQAKQAIIENAHAVALDLLAQAEATATKDTPNE